METILGLDLGTNSIGWAIRDPFLTKSNQIIDKGVLTFDKGVAEEKGKEIPLVKVRTEARSKRRNYQAEKYRKWALLHFLIENNMTPLSSEELKAWKEYKKDRFGNPIGRKYPQSEKFIQWLRFDFDGDGKPDFDLFDADKHESYYLFRRMAVSEEEPHRNVFRQNPHILGRVLYQLVQRRGYRGRDDDSEEAKTILQGSEKNNTKGVQEIEPYIERYRTLGAALYHIQKENHSRIRKRYILRTHYEQELKEICRVQNLDAPAYKHLWNAIIWQRPLRSQKGLVGYCTFESPQKEKNKYVFAGKKRCAESHPFYEEFRTWQLINNLKIKAPEGVDHTQYLHKAIYPLFYTAQDFKLEKIIKRLKKDGAEMESRFSPDTKVISCKLLNSLSDVLGENWKEHYGWKEALSGENKPASVLYSLEDIWHVLFTFDSKEKLKDFAVQKLNLDAEKAEKFSKIKLAQGYATLSLAAIKKILPYLQKGLIYSEAIYLANAKKVLGLANVTEEIGNKILAIVRGISSEFQVITRRAAVVNGLISDQLNAEKRHGMTPDYQLGELDKKEVREKLFSEYGADTWQNKLTNDEREAAYSFCEQKYLEFLRKPINAKKDELFLKPGRKHDRIFQKLQQEFHVPDKNIEYLWHPSEQETYTDAKEIEGIKQLGDPRPISNGFKNPMALRTLHEMKKLVNYLLKEKKINEDTRIVVEIARELNDANRRKAIEKWQRDREKENRDYLEKIREHLNDPSAEVSKDMVDKYRLWVEQNQICLYTGKVINLTELFDGARYNWEHTIPASVSFDNELSNLTMADTDYNINIKKNSLPTQCPNYDKDAFINGKEYTAILPRLEQIFGKISTEKKKRRGIEVEVITCERITKLEDQLSFWVSKTRSSGSREEKDNCIQRRRYIGMELDYWRKKFNSFTCKEIKAGWKNSQLKDTQVVTKYALPYLKTIFKRVDVQKGNVTAAFRDIYEIKPKDRSFYSHHAIDAAILTLIPPPSIRDSILKPYFEMKDENPTYTYHTKPKDWPEFKPYYIHAIEEEVINNFQPRYRTLEQTRKNVRKRGKQQYQRYKDEHGKWHYQLGSNGKRILKVAQGDTIRGQLHKESFFGAIKLPKVEERNGKFIPVTDGKGNFVFQYNDKRKDNLFIVSRVDLSSFTKMEDLDIIIDPNLRQYLEMEIGNRMRTGSSFEAAIAEPIYAFGKKTDKNGNPISPIRHIRCRVKGGGGGFVTNPASIRKHENFASKHNHKRNVYALNGETALCAFYQSVVEGEPVRVLETYSILDIARARKTDTLLVSQQIEKKIKGAIHFIPLYAKLKVNQRVLFYESDIEELKFLDKKQLGTRLYSIVKFEDGKISLKHHLNAMPEDELKKKMKELGKPDTGASAFDPSCPIPKLRLSQANLNFAIEGKHFEIKPDGQIVFL